MKPKIAVVGSFNTDLTVFTPRMPIPGETILGGPYYTGPGGKGANQAVAAARLGAQVSMVVKLGQDYYGDQALENLIQEGIDTRGVIRTTDTHTGVAFIVVDQQGENMIVVASGANAQLTPADIDGVRDVITGADIVLLQLEVPMETVAYTAALAHAAGVTVLLNPAPAQPLSPDLLAHVDYLTPNESEAQLISGLPVADVVGAEAAARWLTAQGVRTPVITLGAKGALASGAAGFMHVPGRKVEVVDTTGAGDAFNGALAVALGEGKDLAAAVAFANTAAALQVTQRGTAPAMPRREAVESFLAQKDG